MAVVGEGCWGVGGKVGGYLMKIRSYGSNNRWSNGTKAAVTCAQHSILRL